MATVSYITPITNRTYADVTYARQHQDDLENKNIGAWNYTDVNRISNNLKYVAEYMYEQGFLLEPYSFNLKLDWTEKDILTSEVLNNSIISTMNNLKSYSRPDLTWYPIASVANMNYSIANWIERNINALATQVPIPPDTYKLTVENGSGSGVYEPRTVVTIQADPAPEGMIFDSWSGDHLENIGNANAMITTYEMPYQDIKLKANYTSTVPHTLTVKTYTKTQTASLHMGETYFIEADPAPEGKVFHHWDVTPSQYENNLYEPAATTHFTMPNEAVTLSAFYITKGQKQLNVVNGKGSGLYDYGSYAFISSNKPSGATFTKWTGDTQYLTGPATQEYNSVKIPDVNTITVRANWSVPPVTNVGLTVVNGVIASTGATSGLFTEGDKVKITANAVPEGKVFNGWSKSGGGSISSSGSMTATVTIGTSTTTVTATYRTLEYYTLTVTTNSGTTTSTKERYDYFSINANPAPDGYIFDKWTGNTSGLSTTSASTGTTMGAGDRTITATYRPINPHTLTVKQLSGDKTYEQAELSKVTITAEDAPSGKRFVRWTLSGSGSISSSTSKTITYTFGNGNATLTPVYVNVWTVTVVGGTINGSSSATLDEGSSYTLKTRSLAVYEKFNGWSQSGPGTISNTSSTSTSFKVGAGDATITASITQYPDKTLTVYWRHPDTGVDTLQFQRTYTYGTKITGIEAYVAPNQTTFSTWLGDTSALKPSALASTVSINSLTTDTTIIATYYYPEAPEYYTLTVYKGYPSEGTYAVGSQIEIRAETPNAGWEFYTWFGDTEFIVNQEGLNDPVNSVIMPQKSITLKAKFNVVGELPTWDVSVSNGIAEASYYPELPPPEGEEDNRVLKEVKGNAIQVPEGIEVKLTADPDTENHEFSRWEGNFDQAGVTDIVKTQRVTTFTMPRADMNIQMRRELKQERKVYTTNATGPTISYVGNTYDIVGNLRNTDDYHYKFEYWICVDADGNDCSDAIEEIDKEATKITIPDKDLWVEAKYTTYYRLTVIEGQNTDEYQYYAENETVDSVYANTPLPESRLKFDHWDDPMGVIKNIYDETPIIVMKNTVATITAVFTSIDASGNSVIMTGADIHDELITRQDSYLINGVYQVGALVFDKDGCLGVLTQVDPDNNDDTADFAVKKFFYGGNF